MTAGRAAILDHGTLTIHDVDYGAPGAGEVLVRLVAAGLCHTDLGAIAGGIPFPTPGILGHEGAGIVDAVGEGVTSVRPGDKVLMSFTSCGDCQGCDDGHPAYCTTWQPRNLMGGFRPEGSGTITRAGEAVAGHFFGQSSFGTHSIADERSLVKVSEDADLTVLAPLGCGVLTGFGSVWNVLDPGPEDIVAVYGTGAVGLSGVIAAALRRPRKLITIDLVQERLELASQLGATHVIDASSDDVPGQLAEITDGHGIKLSFDTTGNPWVARGALDATSIGGTVLVCGAPPPGTEISVDIQGILTGKVLRGVTMGASNPRELIPQLVDLHAEGKLPLERLERTYRFEDISQAAQDMEQGSTVKPVIVF